MLSLQSDIFLGYDCASPYPGPMLGFIKDGVTHGRGVGVNWLFSCQIPLIERES